MKITLQEISSGKRCIEILNKGERISLIWPDGCTVLETLALREMQERHDALFHAKRERLFAAAQKQWAKG